MARPWPGAERLSARRYFSRWDFVAIPIVVGVFALLTLGFRGATVPYSVRSSDLTVTLDPRNLPYYALRSFARMFAAVLASLAFTFLYATAAAKSRRAERVLIPILDFLQSLPILGFLTATTLVFMAIFRGSLLGLEGAAVFAIFTSQVWNMTFSFYHSLITLPHELEEASAAMRLSPWQKFWKLEVPFAMPGLVWNTMMSVSGGWFFVVASEAITVPGRGATQFLPGLGSYLALAIRQADVHAMVYAGIALFVLILLYDQVFFRPIVAWAERFKFEQSESGTRADSWLLRAFQRSRILGRLRAAPRALMRALPRHPRAGPGRPLERKADPTRSKRADILFGVILAVASIAFAALLLGFILGPSWGIEHAHALDANPNLDPAFDANLAQQFANANVTVDDDHAVWLSRVCDATSAGTNVTSAASSALANATDPPSNLTSACAAHMVPPGNASWKEVPHVFLLGVFTMLRVALLIFIATLVWVPIGVYIGLRPRLARLVQPFAQFLAAFPANLLFPIAVILIVHFSLDPEVWTAPLMVLGTQWYILFNVIAGASALPTDLKEAGSVYQLRGWQRWKKLIIPGIFPAFVTGGITASGGSWNASIVAEIVTWGSTTLVATGLGAYIASWSTGSFNPHIALGMLVMGLFVLTFNRLLWRPLYHLAETKYRLD